MDRLFYRLLQLSHLGGQWLTKRFTLSGQVVLICLVIAAIIGLDTHQSLSYQIFTFLLSLMLVAIASSFLNRYRYTARRILPRFGTVGMPLTYRIIIEAQSRRSLKDLSLRDWFSGDFPHLKEYQRIAHSSVSVSARRRQWLALKAQKRWAIAPPIDIPRLQSEVEVMGELIPLRRGVLPLRAMTVTCSDPLGLFNTCVTYPQIDSILILPKRYELPPIQLPGGRRYQSGGIALASSVGESEEFRSLREYRPGDPVRKIHWKSWAKVGKPFVREEQDEYFVRHALILDTFQAESHSEKLEEAVAIAASLACEVHTQESLLDLMFVGLESHYFTVGRGLGQTERMLELLASVTPCQDQSFESMIPAIQSRFSLLSGCVCIFLTWDAVRQALIEQLQSLGIPTLVLVIADQSDVADYPDFEGLSIPPNRFQWLSLGKIQEGLWQL